MWFSVTTRSAKRLRSTWLLGPGLHMGSRWKSISRPNFATVTCRSIPAIWRSLFVSQSGETADMRASLEFAKAHGQRVLSVVNVPSSTMARARQIVLPTLAGPEVCLASTKAFTCQLATLACLALAAGLLGHDGTRRGRDSRPH